MSIKKIYDNRLLEKSWQIKWDKEKLYSPDILKSRRQFYNLWMFPYPSAEGLHAGHAFSSTGSDVYGRFMKMNGYDVFQPIGYDAFGIHSENYAISIGQHPAQMIKRTTKYYEKQLKALGHGYDWTRTVDTSDIDYYRWTQWLFVEMFKAGLAYRKAASVNWCPSCKTVLADEQVLPAGRQGISGECERCGTRVEIRELEQWFFRITDYADRLLGGLGKIDWPERIKIAQKNWIGKSEGAKIKFYLNVPGQPKGKHFVEVFTTRPDTLYGATFLAVSPKAVLVQKLFTMVSEEYKQKISKYIKEYTFKGFPLQGAVDKDKSGVFTGVYAVNPATEEEIPIWIADYVLGEVGTGAIMGVPAHDQRDWEFATQYKLPIVEVISGGNIKKQAYDGFGKIVNSGSWNGLKIPDGLEKVIKNIEKKGWGKADTSYHLRDWLISRQRYWGPPIPMIYCKKCAKEGRSWFTQSKLEVGGAKLDNEVGSDKEKSHISSHKSSYHTSNIALLHPDQSDWEHVGWWPVEEKDLPVELPYLKDYQPKGTQEGPLADSPDFYKTKCPACGREARRETHVSDTFLDSSWYFLRYPAVRESENSVNQRVRELGESESQKASKSGESGKPTLRLSDTPTHRHTEYSELSGSLPWDPEITKKWLPVDLYFGGAEHSVLHLMYSRFVTMTLFDMGYLGFEEPFPRFFAHGLMIKDGAKMSKSRGNVVNPDEYIEKFGADTLRLYLMFMGPMDGYPDFRDTGIEGMRRFVERIWDLFANHKDVVLVEAKDSREVLIKMHQTIKKVTNDVEKFHYNTAISAIMEFVNLLREKKDGKVRHAKGGIRCAEWDQALKVLAQLLAPFTPHLSEEVWQRLLNKNGKWRMENGKFKSIHTSSWPKFEPELVKEEKIVIAVQVNGKLRATIKLKASAKGGQAKLKAEVIEAAKADSKVKKWLEGKKITKTVFVPGKLVNFVAS